MCVAIYTAGSASLTLIEGDEQDTGCSWEGENCVNTTCCRRTGFKCWERDANKWASCSEDCNDLKKFGGTRSCKVLGGDKGARTIAPQKEELDYQSLFCFLVVTPQGVVPPGVEAGYEQKIIGQMKKAKASIFACDGSAIYEGSAATTGEWKSIKNTEIFARVWNIVKKSGEYANHKWTVKADADAVFFPDRLRMKLQKYIKPPEKTAIYFHNIDFKFDFMGALEVMSKEAVDLLKEGIGACLEHIGADGGEDIFTMQCLDSLHIAHMDDFSLLKDKYSNPGHFNLFDVDMCDDPTIAAFHPFKAVNSWMGCYKVGMGIVSKKQFTSCEHRWEGEACSLSSKLDHPGNHPHPGSGIVVK